LKFLLGGRVDIFEERKTDRLTNEETSQSDTAFSPRVGIVYQPISPISLYASYARSLVLGKQEVSKQQMDEYWQRIEKPCDRNMLLKLCFANRHHP
jgi:outer membrane receptor for ferric coprogen and ferric-rhodotorulic acid